MLCVVLCSYGLVHLVPMPYSLAAIIIYTYYKYRVRRQWPVSHIVVSMIYWILSQDVDDALEFYLILLHAPNF